MAPVEFYVDRELAARAETAQAATFLIGGYGGWPNFGDYLQLRATVEVHQRLRAGHILCVLLDHRAWGHHERNKVSFGEDVVPIYSSSGDGVPTHLIKLPCIPPSTLVHVYGGGFVNDWWGGPVRLTVEALIKHHDQDGVDGELRLFMSGLQVSPSAELDAWRPLFAQSDYVGARDWETVAILKALLDSDGHTKIQYSGDDALPALAERFKEPARGEVPRTLAAHVNLADYSSGDAARRLERIARALSKAAQHLGTGHTCDLLVAYPSDHVREEEAVQRLEAFYGRLATASDAPHLTFRRRNVFREAIDGTFQCNASFLVTCSYHVALAGLLSNCPTLLLVENDYYRQKAVGLSDAFKSQGFAALHPDEDVALVVRSLLQPGLHRPMGGPPHAMWLGQLEKTHELSRVCLDMERREAGRRLDLTASAFRDVAAQLGELRKRRILEEKLVKEATEHAPITISLPGKAGWAKLTTKSYWSRRRASWLRSIKKRVNTWP